MFWNPTTQKVATRMVFRNNYTKKITLPPKYIPLYVWRLYGDLETELDFPSCEISFCSPAGQLHHLPCFPILHCRLSSHTHACRGLFLFFFYSTCSTHLMLCVTVDSRGRLMGGRWAPRARVCVCVTSLALHQPQGPKNSNVGPFWRNTWKHPIETGRDASLCLWKWIRGSPNVKHHTWKRSLQFLSGIKGSFTMTLNEFYQVEKVNV